MRSHSVTCHSAEVTFPPLRPCIHCGVCMGVDLAGLLGGRMASAEGESVSSGVAYGEGCPLSSRLRGLGERRELPQRVGGGAPAENGFWRILKATKRSFLYLYDTIWGGQFVLAPPAPNSGGGTCPSCPPRDLRP